MVWIDCEMTGLDLTQDVLVEVAALVTDADLNVLGDGIEVVIKPPAEALEQMGDFVRTMHEKYTPTSVIGTPSTHRAMGHGNDGHPSSSSSTT